MRSAPVLHQVGRLGASVGGGGVTAESRQFLKLESHCSPFTFLLGTDSFSDSQRREDFEDCGIPCFAAESNYNHGFTAPCCAQRTFAADCVVRGCFF